MPTLLVLRHAAAQSFAGQDHARALTEQGRREAEIAGRALAAVDPPDGALVSVAQRARETFAIARDHGGFDAEAQVLDDLYGGDVRAVIAAVAAHAGTTRTLLLVGHQPWCATLIELLTGARVRMDTGAVASLQAGPSWDALDPLWCALQWFGSPRTLAAVARGPR
jgi:phosphohistidine phosphatase